MTTITQINTVTNSTVGLTGIATSSNGNILYAVYSNNLSYAIYNSTDSGVSWNELVGSDLPKGGNYRGITTNYNGTRLYAIWNDPPSGMYYSANSGVTWTAVSSSITSFPSLVSIATDSTGTNIITCTTNTIYISTDSGSTFTSVHTTGVNIRSVACSSNFGIYYYSTEAGDVYRSTNLNNTIWTNLPSIVGNNNCACLTCSADGSKVFLSDNNSSLFLYSGGVWETIAFAGGFGLIVSYSNGLGLLSTSGGPTFTTYSLTYSQYPCFKEDSKILCYKDGKEIYRNVQDLRRGDLVKTLRNGYVAVDMIGTTKLHNSKTSNEHRLYRCTPTKYPELTEDLIITGHHSILVSHITDEQRERIKETMGKVYVTDNKYRLAACIDDRAEPYDKEGLYNIWHVALENLDYYMNYGIYANGLLVETCSRRYLKEISGMRLIGE
jgi:hypothetical protein